MSSTVGRALAAAFHTVVATLWLAVATPPLAVVALAVIAVSGGRGFLVLARFWSAVWLRAAGVRLTTRGTERIDRRASYIYMANHASKLDIPALLVALPTATRFLAKRSLFAIPLFGWSLRAAGFVAIDRHDPSQAQSSFSRSMRGMEAGYSLLVFPEGTRSVDGRLHPFKRGGFLLALKSGQPIVPVGVRGTARLQPKGSQVYRPGQVEVVFGEPIAVSDYGVRGRGRLMAEVRLRIAELAELETAER